MSKSKQKVFGVLPLSKAMFVICGVDFICFVIFLALFISAIRRNDDEEGEFEKIYDYLVEKNK